MNEINSTRTVANGWILMRVRPLMKNLYFLTVLRDFFMHSGVSSRGPFPTSDEERRLHQTGYLLADALAERSGNGPAKGAVATTVKRAILHAGETVFMHRAFATAFKDRTCISVLLLFMFWGLAGCGGQSPSTPTPPPVPSAAVSPPEISPTATAISGSTPVYITDATSGTTIVYTLDGSTPSATHGTTCAPSSTVPCFTLVGAAVVNAIAEDSSGNFSAVATQTYTAQASSNACAGWNPQNIYTPSDFTAYQATITSAGATLGADCNGGGYVNYFNTGYGSFGNLIAVAYGRGYQSDIRDSLHSSFYNPTQAGIQDGLGTPVTLTLTSSPEGPGGRINIVPYNMPLFLNGGFCFFPLSYYSPNLQDPVPSCNSASVTDGIFSQELSANISANQQLSSEFSFQGYYEDASNLGNNTASIFQVSVHHDLPGQSRRHHLAVSSDEFQL